MKNVFFQRTKRKCSFKNPCNEIKQKFQWAQCVPDKTSVVKCILDGRLINISNGITGKLSQNTCTEKHKTAAENGLEVISMSTVSLAVLSEMFNVFSVDFLLD